MICAKCGKKTASPWRGEKGAALCRDCSQPEHRRRTRNNALRSVDYTHLKDKGLVRLWQEMSRFHAPNRVMYIPAEIFTAICCAWLTEQGYWYEYPKEREELWMKENI